MLKLKILLVSAVLAAVAIASNNNECVSNIYFNGRAYNYDVVKNIDGNKRFNELSFVGTHHSASYVIDDPLQKTQDWTIPEQLEAGVRVFHFKVQSDYNDLSIYLQDRKLSLKFNANILPMINEFLDAHPEESVIVYFNEEGGNSAVNGSNCDAMDKIKNSTSGHRVNTKWTLDDLVRDYRGEILIAADKSFKSCSNMLENQCMKDGYTPANNVDDVIYKWKAILELQELIYLRKHDCYIYELYLPNDLQSNLRLISADGGYKTSDGMCAEPLNTLMILESIQGSEDSPFGLIIVMTDFVNQKLINVVQNNN
ncbi:hypothetical protein KQX54_001726 [Cotesia glomerata]|uniref:Uncharacterized protein n=1 Tax=Cotesia glomerata TaxID=32391 RepID=A0AAV7J5H0_COTGL|nr:hypothetical protein KQX54_001726 [Cotesia glomerata]